MIQIRQLTDAALIRDTITHPRVWGAVTDDGAGRREDFAPHQGVHYAGVFEVHEDRSETYLGLWAFAPRNTAGACWEVHTCLLPVAYGATALDAARAVERWFWETHPEATRLVTVVSEDKPLALRFAKRCGMRQWGVNERSTRRGGQLFDEIWLGKTREVELCR